MLCAKFEIGPVILEKKMKKMKIKVYNNDGQILIRKALLSLRFRWAKKGDNVFSLNQRYGISIVITAQIYLLIGTASQVSDVAPYSLLKLLAHLSWKLKWAFLIACCPSSVRPSVRLLTFHIFIFFSRTTGPISTKLGTKHPWMMGITVCSNKWHLPRGDSYEIAKIH